jgi:hypothetical protein
MSMENIESALVTLNYRLTSRAANIWKGNISKGPQYELYEGYLDLLDPDAINRIRRSGDQSGRTRRIFHSLLGHYIQHQVMPYDNELSMWMRGAAAHVDGLKIYFKDILAWCQKKSNFEQRRTIEKETSSLSKFLKPFAFSSWEFVLGLIEEEFEFEDYVVYCHDKKGVDYASYTLRLEDLLGQTDDLYFSAMERWTRKSFEASLLELNRFDAIYLLGLGELDGIYPSHTPLNDYLRFFEKWGIAVAEIPGIHFDIDYSERKGSQAMSFTARIPQEIHLVMNPQGGWIDLETLFHEMGHVLSAAFTSSDLPPVEKDLYTSNTLSESYAFLLQNMCFTPVFLERQLGLAPKQIDEILYYKALKDMSLFRRYAAKFLAEYRMFRAKDLENGEIYASLLNKHTGFSYKPETHLFDLVPELYSLDYVLSWAAEVTMAKTLAGALGDEWMFKRETGEILKQWWADGNRYELEEFFTVHDIGSLDFTDIAGKWNDRIS